MNKRIYFNNCYVEFTKDLKQIPQNQLIEIGADLNLGFENFFITKFLSENNEQNFFMSEIYFNDIVTYFKHKHYYIEAAGGLIQKDNKFLFIKRHGKWDLPKGKLEKKESIEEGAIRECEEECNIDALKIETQLTSTFHIYAYKKSFALKQTYWFKMTTTSTKQLLPQQEEHITEVLWFTPTEIKKEILKNTYLTIADVLTEITND